MRRSLLAVFGVLVAAGLSAGSVWAGNGGSHPGKHWPWSGARLTGSQEVPAVTTTMKGWMAIRHDVKGDRMPFHLSIWKGNDVTAAHLHCAVAGQNGPVVVALSGDVVGGYDINGTLAKSAIEDDNILPAGAGCPTAITSVETLKTAIENDQVYVNVHTVAHPSGEIRAQL
jgi:hypothetical protein